MYDLGVEAPQLRELRWLAKGLDAVPDVSGALIRAGIGSGEFGWLQATG